MNTGQIFLLPFRSTRIPLALVDTRIIQRLPQDGWLRLAFDRALGSYDQFAGRLLNDPHLREQGRDRCARTDKLTRAIELEQQAAQRRETAATIAAAGEQQAAELADQAEDRLLDGLERAASTEGDGKRVAAQTAQDNADRMKQQAQERADRESAAIEARRKGVETAAAAETAAAQNVAKAKLHHIADERADADTKRADAATFASLADDKRKARRTS